MIYGLQKADILVKMGFPDDALPVYKQITKAYWKNPFLPWYPRLAEKRQSGCMEILFTFRPFVAKGWNSSVRVSAEFMNYTTRLKPEEMVCTRILAATISYRSKWPAGWKSEWFYVKVDEDEDKLVQSPLELTFEETRPRCNMIMGSPSQIALAEFRVISDHIGTRDLVQNFWLLKCPNTERVGDAKARGRKEEGRT